MLAVSSLPAVSSSLHSFVIVAPPTAHFNTQEPCNVASYSRRGWCRAEVVSHASRRGFNNVYLATGKGGSDIELLGETEYDLKEAVKVFDGGERAKRANFEEDENTSHY